MVVASQQLLLATIIIIVVIFLFAWRKGMGMNECEDRPRMPRGSSAPCQSAGYFLGHQDEYLVEYFQADSGLLLLEPGKIVLQ